MTNKEYVNGLIDLYNSAEKQLANFKGFEEPTIEIRRENCEIDAIIKELNKKGFKTEIKQSTKIKQEVLFIQRGLMLKIKIDDRYKL